MIDLEEHIHQFWKLRSSLQAIQIKPRKPEAPSALIQVLKDAPYRIGKRNISQHLEEAYFKVSEAAIKKSLSD